MDSMYQTTISTMRKEVGITSKSNPIYHLCRKSGHIVQKCYHRFGLSFSGVNSSHQNLKDTSSTSGFTGNGSSDGMTAMVATRPEFMDDNCSFPYFGATNHVTNDLRKLLSTQNTQELDQSTKEVLLEGVVDGGLYEFHLIKSSQSITQSKQHFHLSLLNH